MSLPQNHHYVSKCHIKNFFDEHGYIHLYDKKLFRFYSKTSSKNIFSEKLLNSFYRKGQVNHNLLEKDLKVFEDDFPSAVKILEQAVSEKNIGDNCKEALTLFGLFAIIGDLRTPFRKKSLDDSIEMGLNKLRDWLCDEQRQALDATYEFKKHVKYSNLILFSETALRTHELMGGFDYTIWHITGNDSFILPDTSATHIRGNLSKKFNPHARQVIELGIPITKKIFINVTAKKLKKGSFLCCVDKDNDPTIRDINLHIYHHSYRTVASDNAEYLKSIVSHIDDGS